MANEPFAAFESFVTYASEVDELLGLSIYAIANLQGLGRLVDVLSKSTFEDTRSKYSQAQVEQAHKIEERAKSELDKGYPLLIAHSVVALWSALEACIPSFCSDWLVAHPELLSNQSLERIKIPASLFGSEERASAMTAVVLEIARQTDASLKPGIGRFQCILERLSIGFAIEDGLRKTLFEMSKVRNLIVHMYSRADKKFVEECPWFDMKPGDQLALTRDDYRRYRSATGEYTAQIVLAAQSYQGPKTLENTEGVT